MSSIGSIHNASAAFNRAQQNVASSIVRIATSENPQRDIPPAAAAMGRDQVLAAAAAKALKIANEQQFRALDLLA